MNKTRKLGLILIVAALLVLLPVGLVFADAKGTVRGVVQDVDEDGSNLILETKNGEITVWAPEGFVFDSSLSGKTVLVKGQWMNDTDFKAEWVKQVDLDEEKTEETEETQETEDEEDTFQNAFCTGAKETNHPLAAKIVAKYGKAIDEVTGEENSLTEVKVMKWFCNGHSFGQIMLALTTQILDGSDPDKVLAARKNGQGWGQIWKEKFLIGSEREGMPPGWVKKPDKGESQRLQNQPGFVPPGLLKKTPTP